MNRSDIPHLIVQGQDPPVRHDLLDGPSWTIGRSSQADIRIADDRLSRQHAMIQCTSQGAYTLTDVGSRNGSFVNGRRITFPCPLTHGDRIALGNLEFQFQHPATLTQEANEQDTTPPTDADDMTVVNAKRTLISTLVIDVRDFTGMTHRLGDETLAALMSNFFNHAGQVLEAHGSHAEKYIGDSVMALWFHDNPARILADARQLFQTLQKLIGHADTLSKQYQLDPPFRIGAGINTGYAMVGNTGTAQRPDHTALGDSVTKAFRLETASKMLSVDLVLGQDTYQRLSDAGAQNLPLHPCHADLKGYPEPIPVFTAHFDALANLLTALES